MEITYANNCPGHKWDEKLSTREREILSYSRAWFWRGTDEEWFLMRRLLEIIHTLEDKVDELKHELNKSE
jgi:hypothetical protein